MRFEIPKFDLLRKQHRHFLDMEKNRVEKNEVKIEKTLRKTIKCF